MRGKLNAHRLFRGTTGTSGYLDNLNITAEKEKSLKRARDIARDAIRAGMATLRKSLIVEQRYADRVLKLPSFQPRFRMQGSAQYKTLNDPAQKPPQEIDYDFGVFLPTSFLKAGGKVHPIIAAKAFFKEVEAILQPVCEKHGWSLDRSKENCVRIDISEDSHLDLPLYSIPDDEFVQLTEARERLLKSAQLPIDVDSVFAESVYSDLPDDSIMLAQRNGKWIESDPRRIEKWFSDAISVHDEVLRYICRYYKGWRDHQWEDCCLSSLAIMVCVVRAFDELNGVLPSNRDDTAMLLVSEKISSYLGQPVPNPVIPDQVLDGKWAPEDRKRVVARAEKLHKDLSEALDQSYHKGLAIERLRAAFGKRVPNDETLITIDSAEREILSFEPVTVPAPRVQRSQSG